MNHSKKVSAYAPATVANLGPGFDVLGLAVKSPGDIVHVWVEEEGPPGVQIREINGTKELPYDASLNTAGVAAARVLECAGSKVSISLVLEKGMPLGSGMGSSGASAAAAAFATNHLLGAPLENSELLQAAREGERVACGSPHADNVAPSLFGGIVLLRPDFEDEVISLPVPPSLWCGLVRPNLHIRTADARSVLPKNISVEDAVFTNGNLASLVSALYEGDLQRLGRSIQDRIATPHRSSLIPGYEAAVQGVKEVGGLACGLSGSGPTLFVLAASQLGCEEGSEVVADVFHRNGLESTTWVSEVSAQGARIV